jgi:L-amino acid N-acyltransferase YncA
VDVTIEEFSEEDVEELEELFKIVWSKAYEYPAHWRKKRQITKEQIKKEMRSGYHFFGARNTDGSIVGVYKLIMTEEGCFGEHQSILPGYTGKKVASAMYEQFIHYAKVHDCKKNYVYVLESHDACKHLVEKYGFVEVDAFEQAPGMKVYKYERGIS